MFFIIYYFIFYLNAKVDFFYSFLIKIKAKNNFSHIISYERIIVFNSFFSFMFLANAFGIIELDI